MARFSFGGDLTAWTFASVDDVDTVDNLAQLVGGAVVTFWNLEVGGTQYTDLLDDAGEPITQVVSADGLGAREVGTIPPFEGPDGIAYMWAQGGDGPRAIIVAWNIADGITNAVDTAAAALSGLETHESAPNPHGTATTDLVDVSDTPPAANQVLIWNDATGQYEPSSAPGTGTVTSVNSQTPDGAGNVALSPAQITPAAATAADMAIVKGQMHVLLLHTGSAYPAKPAGFALAIRVGPTEPVSNVVDGDIWLQPEST